MKRYTDKIVTKYLSENSIILDIETTGVHRELSSVIVVGFLKKYDGINDNFMQYYITNLSDERELLEKIIQFIENRHVITYNGQYFDIPFIKSRCEHLSIIQPSEKSQFDIYRFLISNKNILNTSEYSLQSIEKYLKINRYEDFSLKSDILFYSDEDNSIKNILLHNKYDVINTEKILYLVDKIKNLKTFNFNGKNFYINKISHDKNILELEINAPNTDLEYHYESNKFMFKWIDDNIYIKLKIYEGYISESVLGYVYILENNQNIINLSDFELPKNILLIYSNNMYAIENIKNLIKDILSSYL